MFWICQMENKGAAPVCDTFSESKRKWAFKSDKGFSVWKEFQILVEIFSYFGYQRYDDRRKNM